MTRGLPVTAATRGTFTKWGTIQRSTSGCGRPSASTISTISPASSGSASLSAIALPSLTRLVRRRISPASASPTNNSEVRSLEPSSTTVTSNEGQSSLSRHWTV
jgi:hypothetical protein